MPTAAARGASTSAKRPTGGTEPVRVTFLGPHDKLKDAFWVQEQGKRRGLIKYGTRPSPLPSVGSEIKVYPTNDNPQSPEYRWDLPPDETQPPRGRGRR